MLTAHEEKFYAEDMKKYPKLRLSLSQAGPVQINQAKRYFHTLRHFPDVRMSLAEIATIDPEQLDKNRPKSRNIVHGLSPPRPISTPKKLKADIAMEKMNSISRKMDKLCVSSLGEMEDRYKILRRGIVRTRMERNRAELIRTQPCLKPRQNEHLEGLRPSTAPIFGDNQHLDTNGGGRNYLGKACLKLRKAGLSTLHENCDRKDILGSGLLAIIGVTVYTELTAKQFSSMLLTNLGVKLNDMELLALHTTIFIRRYHDF